MASEYLKDFKTVLHSTYDYMIEEMDDWKGEKIGAIYPAIFAIISPVYKIFDTEEEAVKFRKEMLSDIFDFINEVYYGRTEGSPYPHLIPSLTDFFHVIGYLYYQIRVGKDDAKTIGQASWPGQFALWSSKHKEKSELYLKINCVCHTIRNANGFAGRTVDKIKENTPEFGWVADVINEKFDAWERYATKKWVSENEK